MVRRPWPGVDWGVASVVLSAALGQQSVAPGPNNEPRTTGHGRLTTANCRDEMHFTVVLQRRRQAFFVDLCIDDDRQAGPHVFSFAQTRLDAGIFRFERVDHFTERGALD